MKPPLTRIPAVRLAGPLALAFALCAAPDAPAQIPRLLHHQGRVAVDGVNFDGTGQFKFALVDGGSDVSRQATATATVKVGGGIASVTVTDGGHGYSSTRPPAVTVKSKLGSGAVLLATVVGSAVNSIQVLQAGSGYSTLDPVVIDDPAAVIVHQQFWSNDGTGSGGAEPVAAVALPVAKGLFDVLLGDTALPNMTALPAAAFAHPDVRLRVWFNDGSHGFQRLLPDKRIAAVGYAVISESVPDGAIDAAKLADNAVTAAKLAAGAVERTHIANGAVGADQIAPGAVAAAQLAKPPRSGSIASAGLDFQFNQAAFTVPFSPPFAGSPIVTLAVRGGVSRMLPPAVWVTAAGPSSFSGRFGVPVDAAILDPSDDTGHYASLVLDQFGSASVAYYDRANHDLKFVRASNASGSIWADPVTVTSLGKVGMDASLAVVFYQYAIAYCSELDFGIPPRPMRSLEYVAATDYVGERWGSPTTVGGIANVRNVSLASAGIYPMIACYRYDSGDLLFVRATQSDGSAWSAPVNIDSAGDVGAFASLAMVNGNPAIAYQDVSNGDLKYIRASDAQGIAWGPPVVIDSTGNVGEYASLAVVAGNPAIAYRDASNGDLKFARATDASGTAWSAPLTLDSADDVGIHVSLALVTGNPAVAYRDAAGNLKYVRAANASGTAWGAPAVVDSSPGASYTSLAEIGGRAAIAFRHGGASDLRFVRQADPPAAFSIDWIALEP